MFDHHRITSFAEHHREMLLEEAEFERLVLAARRRVRHHDEPMHDGRPARWSLDLRGTLALLLRWTTRRPRQAVS